MPRDELIVLAGEQADQLTAQDRQITALATQVADLMEANEQLTAKLERMEHLLSRNSGNSSLPPSMDDQPGRTPPPGKPQRGGQGKRNPGKQPGAAGSYLAWSGNPGRTVPHFPRGACACGADLTDAADLGVAASYQEIEIPEMAVQVIHMTCTRRRAGAGGCTGQRLRPGRGRPAPSPTGSACRPGACT